MLRRCHSVTIALLLVICSLGWLACSCTEGKSSETREPTPKDKRLVAGYGTIEPRSEIIRLSFETSGKVSRIAAKEGDRISRGQVLAELENRKEAANVQAAKAELDSCKAILARLRAGAREEEKEHALANEQEADAHLIFAKRRMNRQRSLLRKKLVSQQDYEDSELTFNAAAARKKAATQRRLLVEAGSREEDLARAAADIAHAKAKLDDAKARYVQTFLYSPIDGFILRKYHHVGECVSSVTGPDILFEVGDLSKLHARIEIDEEDIGRVRTGQKAYVVSKAHKNTRYEGRVIRVGMESGNKKVHAGEIQEYVDTRIVEVLIELEDAPKLPVGLRVDGFVIIR